MDERRFSGPPPSGPPGQWQPPQGGQGQSDASGRPPPGMPMQQPGQPPNLNQPGQPNMGRPPFFFDGPPQYGRPFPGPGMQQGPPGMMGPNGPMFMGQGPFRPMGGPPDGFFGPGPDQGFGRPPFGPGPPGMGDPYAFRGYPPPPNFEMGLGPPPGGFPGPGGGPQGYVFESGPMGPMMGRPPPGAYPGPPPPQRDRQGSMEDYGNQRPPGQQGQPGPGPGFGNMSQAPTSFDMSQNYGLSSTSPRLQPPPPPYGQTVLPQHQQQLQPPPQGRFDGNFHPQHQQMQMQMPPHQQTPIQMDANRSLPRKTSMEIVERDRRPSIAINIEEDGGYSESGSEDNISRRRRNAPRIKPERQQSQSGSKRGQSGGSGKVDYSKLKWATIDYLRGPEGRGVGPKHFREIWDTLDDEIKQTYHPEMHHQLPKIYQHFQNTLSSWASRMSIIKRHKEPGLFEYVSERASPSRLEGSIVAEGEDEARDVRKRREDSISSETSVNAKRRRESQDEAGGEVEDDDEGRARYTLRRSRGGAEADGQQEQLTMSALPPVRRQRPSKPKTKSYGSSRFINPSAAAPLFVNYNNFQPPQEFYTSPNPFLANFSLSVDSLLFSSNRLERKREDLRPTDPLAGILDLPDRTETTDKLATQLAENEGIVTKLHQLLSPTWTMATQIRAYETRQKELKKQYDELSLRMEAIRHEAQQTEDRFLDTDVKRSDWMPPGGTKGQTVKMVDLIQQLDEMRQTLLKAEGDMKSLRKEAEDKSRGGISGDGAVPSPNGDA